MPEDRLRELIELCHRHDVLVSTGGFIEHVLTQGPDAVGKYVRECKRLGFDILEISAGFLTIPTDDWLRLVELVQKTGLKAKPEVGIQFGAGGATASTELAVEGTRDVAWTIGQAKRFLAAGAYLVMIESEGITESVTTWRTDVATRLVDSLGPTRSCSRPQTPKCSPGTSSSMDRRSTCSSITARSCSSKRCVRGYGGRRARGAGL